MLDLARPLSGPVATGFRRLSSLRRDRIVHPRGLGFKATLTPRPAADTGTVLFDRRTPVDAVVRLSRALGLPEWLPDPCGLAIRVPDAYGPGAHQDFLLITSGAPPGLRHLISPARGVGDRPYSSLTPYRFGARRVIVGASASAGGHGGRLSDLARAPAAAPRFELLAGDPLGALAPVARLDLGARLPAERERALRFNPVHSGGGIEPVGFINSLRPPAYEGSQRGWLEERRPELTAPSGSDPPAGEGETPP